ncbi:MAG: protein kinase [Polyangiales bacterium]
MTVGHGERWGNYLLEERIAAGGMAEVFRARRIGAVGFSKLVCIKRMHRHLSDDAEFVGLFLDEGRTGSKLRHRNIVAVDDLGDHGGQFFIAMEYVHGVDLSQLEARLASTGEPFPANAAVFVAMEVLAALGAAHRAVDPDDGTPLRVVHRDVAPHNILLSYSGEVKLGDFGIARAERRAQVTSGGVVRGRFGYMPLEQLSGNPIDGRADLYALGVVLYEMLAGHRPFHGGGGDATVESIVAMQVVDNKRPIAEVRAGLSEELCVVVDTLLAKDPDERFSSAEAALAVLERSRERLGASQAFCALMARLYPTQASVATASSPAIARVSASGMPPPQSASPSLAPAPLPDASQRRGPVLQVLGDKSDPLAKPFDTDPATTPPATIAANTTSTEVLAVRGAAKPRWPMLLLAVSLSVASASAITVAVISRANSGTNPQFVADAAVVATRAVEDSGVTIVGAEDAAAVAIASDAGPAVTARIERHANTRSNGGSGSSERDAGAIVAVRAEVPDVQTRPAVTSSATTSAPSGRGTLRIVVTPFGQVSIDNGPLSDEFRNARDFPVSAGRHRVRVTGGVDDEVSVDVGPDETRVVRFHSNE